jgi:hypothetical protein
MNRAKNIKSSPVFFLKKTVVSLAILIFLLAGATRNGKAQITEGFDNITTLPAAGWVMKNNSTPVGTIGWFQGNPAIFPSQSGAANSYIGANYNNTTDTNTISNWLLTPNRALYNGSVIKFWTRTTAKSPFPDRLEVRLSTNGASTNVGTGSTAVGDFTTLLTSINPNLEVGGYPDVWTEFTVTLSGLPSCGSTGVNGRLAFRYFVTGGGPAGDNSNYIGIDSVLFVEGFPIPPPPEVRLDYNGDLKSDYAVVRDAGGSGGQKTWHINNGTTHTQMSWGLSTDIPVSGDFDGDDKADITVYRPAPAPNSFFYCLKSLDNTLLARELGQIGDDPTVVGNYDADGKTDFAVYRSGASTREPSFWYYRGSLTPNGGITFVQWGQHGDTPAPGDYDGDRRNDFCVRRDNGNGQAVFHLNQTCRGTESVVWGYPADSVSPGDYDGDRRTDFAVLRNQDGQIIWNVLGRNNGNIIHFGQPWGLSATDFPVQGDYDGDGKTDIAVWHPSADPAQNFFYVRKSSNGALLPFEWGQQGDYPVANFNNH